jgi:hypothetical protein
MRTQLKLSIKTHTKKKGGKKKSQKFNSVPTKTKTHKKYRKTPYKKTVYFGTPKNQYNELPQEKTIIVGKIYSNGCIHCINMADEWSKLIENLKNKNNIVFNDIEASDNLEGKILDLNNKYLSNSSEKLVANGFPTIYKIVGGKLEYYNGADRMAFSFEKWINQ